MKVPRTESNGVTGKTAFKLYDIRAEKVDCGGRYQGAGGGLGSDSASAWIGGSENSGSGRRQRRRHRTGLRRLRRNQRRYQRQGRGGGSQPGQHEIRNIGNCRLGRALQRWRAIFAVRQLIGSALRDLTLIVRFGIAVGYHNVENP